MWNSKKAKIKFVKKKNFELRKILFPKDFFFLFLVGHAETWNLHIFIGATSSSMNLLEKHKKI